jgi:hypothetical protein
MHSRRFGLAAAACKGNENFPSDSRRKAGPEFIGSSISLNTSILVGFLVVLCPSINCISTNVI